MKSNRSLLLILFAFWLLLPTSDAAAAQAAQPTPVISRCEQPFMFGFGAWEKARTAFAVQEDGIHISAENGQGGAGVAGLKLDTAEFPDWTPTLTLMAGERNRASHLNLHLTDADGTSHQYRFDLRGLKPRGSQRVVAQHGASLTEPQAVEKPGKAPGLDGVASYLVIGDWSGNPVELVLSRIEWTPPTDALRAERATLRELKAREAEQARREASARERTRLELLEKGAPHPPDGPEVRQVCAVAPDVIAVRLQAGKHVSNQLVPYLAQPGDEIVEEEKDKPRHTVKNGQVVDYVARALYRRVNNQRARVGLLSPDGHEVFVESSTAGQLLDETVVDLPAAYSVQSPDDPAYAAPTAPAAVYRKGKPNGFSRPLPFVYTISLRLPSPLKEGAAYAIRFAGVNTSQETVSYAHKPRETRSLAVHAIQTGYRPDDPYKRAYLSWWMGVDKDGKQGSCALQPDSFELLDATGRTRLHGQAGTGQGGGSGGTDLDSREAGLHAGGGVSPGLQRVRHGRRIPRLHPRPGRERTVPHRARCVGGAVQSGHAGHPDPAAGDRAGAAGLPLPAAEDVSSGRRGGVLPTGHPVPGGTGGHARRAHD